MRKIILSVFVFLSFNSFAQQSKSYSERPENVDKGIIVNSKASVIISGVPSYLWRRGCGPTAVGMVVGYYDENGYSDLIQGSSASQTSFVNDAIANEEHYNDYSLPLDYYSTLLQDNSQLGGAHSSNCIADFMNTSWSSRGNYWGWSWSSDIDNSFINYVALMNSAYSTSCAAVGYSDVTAWDSYKVEIDSNRPVVFLVDSDGDGSTDHFVTGIGYDNDTKTYGIYDTWDNDIHWFSWHAMTSGNAWGIYNFMKFLVSGSIEIEKINSSEITVFPNPVKEKLKIYMPRNSELTYFKVINFQGKVVCEDFLRNDEIDFSNYPNGIYFIEIIEENSKITFKKIVVEK
jgi:hypothetical protein